MIIPNFSPPKKHQTFNKIDTLTKSLNDTKTTFEWYGPFVPKEPIRKTKKDKI